MSVAEWGDAGSGDALLTSPTDVAVDADGYVYVTDNVPGSNPQYVKKYTAAGAFVTKWGGRGTGNAEFRGCWGLAVRNGHEILVVDSYHPDYYLGDTALVKRFDSTGGYLGKISAPGLGDGQLWLPWVVATDLTGKVYVANTGNSRVEVFAANGKFVRNWGGWGTSDGQLQYPYGVAVNPAGTRVYVVDRTLMRVQQFTANGGFVRKWGEEGHEAGQFEFPWDIAVDAQGYVYVTDCYNNRVQKFTASGTLVTAFGTQGSGGGAVERPAGPDRRCGGPGLCLRCAQQARPGIRARRSGPRPGRPVAGERAGHGAGRGGHAPWRGGDRLQPRGGGSGHGGGAQHRRTPGPHGGSRQEPAGRGPTSCSGTAAPVVEPVCPPGGTWCR